MSKHLIYPNALKCQSRETLANSLNYSATLNLWSKEDFDVFDEYQSMKILTTEIIPNTTDGDDDGDGDGSEHLGEYYELPDTKYIKSFTLIFHDDTHIKYYITKVLGSGISGSVIEYTAHDKPEINIPDKVCIKFSVTDNEIMVYEKLLNNFCDDTIVPGYLLMYKTDDGEGIPVVIMDQMDGQLNNLNEVLSHLDFIDKFIMMINVVIQLTYTLKCLARFGFWFQDIHIGNILYQCADDGIRIYLTDMDVSFMHKSQPELTEEEYELNAVNRLKNILVETLFGFQPLTKGYDVLFDLILQQRLDEAIELTKSFGETFNWKQIDLAMRNAIILETLSDFGQNKTISELMAYLQRQYLVLCHQSSNSQLCTNSLLAWNLVE